MKKSEHEGKTEIILGEKKLYKLNSETKQFDFIFYHKAMSFYYYKSPVIDHINPHCSSYDKSGIITIFGSFFFSKPEFNCVLKCHFDNIIVEAKYINNLTVQCNAPIVKKEKAGLESKLSNIN